MFLQATVPCGRGKADAAVLISPGPLKKIQDRLLNNAVFPSHQFPLVMFIDSSLFGYSLLLYHQIPALSIAQELSPAFRAHYIK